MGCQGAARGERQFLAERRQIRLCPIADFRIGSLRPSLSATGSGARRLLSASTRHSSCCQKADSRPTKVEPTRFALVFDVTPGAVMLVAAHQDDPGHTRAAGLKTSCSERPLEYGLSQQKDVSENADNRFHANDLIQLTQPLGR